METEFNQCTHTHTHPHETFWIVGNPNVISVHQVESITQLDWMPISIKWETISEAGGTQKEWAIKLDIRLESKDPQKW